MWKNINWVELDIERCEITELFPYDDQGNFGLKIKHPISGKPKYFQKSHNKNWTWISPIGRDIPQVKTGYIIKDSLENEIKQFRKKVEKIQNLGNKEEEAQ